ncbi:MAG: amidohydrolase family protein [Chloroflexota bacterium]|nr:amidohydrolase family protein [Chloroflexota bacterium]
MSSDLAEHIATIRVIDTHSHMESDLQWEKNGPPDVLVDLFGMYSRDDLVVAGAASAAVERLLDGADPDIEGRFDAIAGAWHAMQFTGYGEVVRIVASQLYGIEELSGPAARQAQTRLDTLRTAEGCLHLLRDRAKLDHIQIDSGLHEPERSAIAPDFYLYDLSWAGFCRCDLSTERRALLAEMTDVTVTDLASLRRAMETLFERYGPQSIAVKSQHAYQRTLSWQERDDASASRALQAILANDPDTTGSESPARLCLGDWCLARGAELAETYGLPFKIHTGYLAGTATHASTGDGMPLQRLRAANLTPLLTRYPRTRFVLMHISYPYDAELLAIAKRFPNAYVDLCWAWSIDPVTSGEFVRRFLHTAPINKLFGFGDDTRTPTMAYGYAVQMRRWLTRTLEAEVVDGLLTTTQAMDIATQLLRSNQQACFDIEGRQRALRGG